MTGNRSIIQATFVLGGVIVACFLILMAPKIQGAIRDHGATERKGIDQGGLRESARIEREAQAKALGVDPHQLDRYITPDPTHPYSSCAEVYSAAECR